VQLEAVDFDRIESWSASLTRALEGAVSPEVVAALRDSEPEFIEDARALLFELAPKNDVIAATIQWLESECLVAYHGTRLTSSENDAVAARGLIPLTATERRHRLARALSRHPRWSEVRGRLQSEIESHGSGQTMGAREGQVHLTLSRGGLESGFNHYLQYGSEYDQRVAHALLGQEGVDLLAEDGAAVLVSVGLPGARALSAAHPYFTVSDVIGMGEVPNVVSEFLDAWSYRTAVSDYDPSRSRVDCGFVFQERIPESWIVDIQVKNNG